ncbi:hypothetical protein TUBRATIS_14400, partial [Tubulinosema ratisbonensis]
MNFFYFVVYCNCNLLSLKITFNKMFIDLCKLPRSSNLDCYIKLKCLVLNNITSFRKTENLDKLIKNKILLLKILKLEDEECTFIYAEKKAYQNLVFLIHFLKFVQKIVRKEKPIFAKNLSYLKILKEKLCKLKDSLPYIQKNPAKWTYVFDDIHTLVDIIAGKCERGPDSYLSNIVSAFESTWLEWNRLEFLERKNKKIDEFYSQLLSDFLEDCHSTQGAKYKSLISKSQQKFMAEY